MACIACSFCAFLIARHRLDVCNPEAVGHGPSIEWAITVLYR